MPQLHRNRLSKRTIESRALLTPSGPFDDPFVCTATAESIMEKLSRCRSTLEKVQPGCTLPGKFSASHCHILLCDPSLMGKCRVTSCHITCH